MAVLLIRMSPIESLNGCRLAKAHVEAVEWWSYLNDLRNERMMSTQKKSSPRGSASRRPRMTAGTITSLPQGLLRRSINQRVRRSVQRAFQGREFSRSAKGLAELVGSKPGAADPEAAPLRVLLRDGASPPPDFSAGTISSISMVLLSGNFGIWSLKFRTYTPATLGAEFFPWRPR